MAKITHRYDLPDYAAFMNIGFDLRLPDEAILVLLIIMNLAPAVKPQSIASVFPVPVFGPTLEIPGQVAKRSAIYLVPLVLP